MTQVGEVTDKVGPHPVQEPRRHPGPSRTASPPSGRRAACGRARTRRPRRGKTPVTDPTEMTPWPTSTTISRSSASATRSSSASAVGPSSTSNPSAGLGERVPGGRHGHPAPDRGRLRERAVHLQRLPRQTHHAPPEGARRWWSKVRNLSPDVAEVFRITRLDKVLYCDSGDDDGGGSGVPARVRPPRPSGHGAVVLPPPAPTEPE